LTPLERPAVSTDAMQRMRTVGVCLLAWTLFVPVAQAQDKVNSGIYTCTDSRGRKITSDRPIADCLDREQRELGKSGIVKRVVPPSYTAEERARLEEQRKAEDAERARMAEEKRRERALLILFPTQALHDKERANALTQIDDVIAAVRKRGEALEQERKDIDTELEFYKGDVKQAPPWLKRKIEDNEQQAQVQKRFLGDQLMEKQRINARFDEELSKLKQLWGKK
jgi:cell division protein FtsB